MEVTLSNLDYAEGARYLGYGKNKPDDAIMNLMYESEKDILSIARPKYIYKVFDIKQLDNGVEIQGSNFILDGKTIKYHLEGCDKVIFLCATLSSDIDKLIRKTQVLDMAKAVVVDALAGVAVEQVCNIAEEEIKKQFPGKYFTFRYGIGYGDLPLSNILGFLKIIEAQKLIGVTANDSFTMSPLKSVACIIGINENEMKPKQRGCITCNMKERCQFRLKGEHCGF